MDAVFATGDFAALFATMQRWAPDAEAQAHGCQLLIGAKDAQVELFSSDATDVLVSALRTHVQHAETCASAGGLLFTMTLNAEHRERAAALGAAEALLAAAFAHHTRPDVQMACCAALLNVAWASQHSAARALDAGAADAAVTMMRAHVSYAAVQRTGVELINMLFRCLRHDPRRSELLCELGATAVTAVVVALCAHATDASVQEQGALALALLGKNPGRAASAVNAGALQALVSSMRVHASNEAVVGSCLRALHNVGGYECTAQHLLNSGALEAVVTLLRRIGACSAELLCAAALALANICATPAVAERACNLGAVAALVLAMTTQHASNDDALETCLSALGIVGPHDPATMAAALAILCSHSSQPTRLLIRACTLLAGVLRMVPAAASGALDAVDTVLAGLDACERPGRCSASRGVRCAGRLDARQ
jgi:hypothetical protein